MVDMFLKIADIDGDSTSEKHKGWIDVLSYSWGATLPVDRTSGGGTATGRTQSQDFSFVKYPDSASPKLMQKVCNGTHITEATLSLVKSGENPQEFMKIKLSDVLISSYQTGGSAGMLPGEQVSFSFAKIELSVAEQNPDGTMGAFSAHTCDFLKNVSA